jgi:hypothetical protein
MSVTAVTTSFSAPAVLPLHAAIAPRAPPAAFKNHRRPFFPSTDIIRLLASVEHW